MEEKKKTIPDWSKQCSLVQDIAFSRHLAVIVWAQQLQSLMEDALEGTAFILLKM